MTVASTGNSFSYAGDDVTKGFPFPRPFFEPANLRVILVDGAGGETVQALGADYSVTGGLDAISAAWLTAAAYAVDVAVKHEDAFYVCTAAHTSGSATEPGAGGSWTTVWALIPEANGGKVSMTTAPATGETLIVTRRTDLKQNTTYDIGGRFSADAHEDALDKLTLQAQDQQEQINRAPKLKESTTSRAPTFPEPEAGKLVGWNSAGTDLVNTAPAASNRRETLTADRTYYIATTGHDSNDGLSASTPFATLQKATDTVAEIDLGAFDVTLEIENGTYTSGVVVDGPWVGRGSVTLSGDVATPTNVVISTTDASCVELLNNARLKIGGVQTTCSGADAHCVSVISSVLEVTGSLDFGSADGHHINAALSGTVFTGTLSHTISGGASRSVFAGQGSTVILATGTFTLTGTPIFAQAFAEAQTCANIGANNVTYNGAATGKRYNVITNAVINTAGGGANHFPGDGDGTTASGGQYV